MNKERQAKKPEAKSYIIAFIILFGAILFISFVIQRGEKTEDDRELHLIALATLALDRYAPEIEYPSGTSGWTVLDNPDGTINVSTPNIGTPIFVMMVPDKNEKDPIPYFVKVGSTVYLDLTDVYLPSGKDSKSDLDTQPSTSFSENEQDKYSEVISNISSFSFENILISETSTRIEITAFDTNISTRILDAYSIGSAPSDWEELLSTWQTDAKKIRENLPDKNSSFTIVSDEDKTTIFATFLNGNLSFDIFDSAPSGGNNPATISKEEFDAIYTGMTYQQVVDLVGGPGEVLSEVDIGNDEYFTRMYSWDGEGTPGANATITVQGGKVTAKAQFGLE